MIPKSAASVSSEQFIEETTMNREEMTREVREKPRKSSVSGIHRIFQEKGSSRLWQMVRKRRKGKRVFSFFFHNNRIKDGWRTPQLPCSCCGGMSALQ